MHAGRFTRITTTMAVLGAALLVAAGCGSDDSKDESSSSKSTTTATTMSTDDTSMTDTTSSIANPGTDLRVTMDRLLAEHAALAYVALTKTIAGEADAEASVTALAGNTSDLADAMGSIYGDEAKAAFQTQWEAHIGMFVAYATATAKGDAAGKAKAAKDLNGYAVSFGKFLADAAGLDQKAATAALGVHAKGLLTAVDQFAAKQYDKSWASERVAYMHMVGTGDALAAAISKQMPDKFGTGSIGSGTADTRVLLDTQLGEHAFLAALATTKSLSGAKDASAAVGALTANSNALAETIGSVYGAAAQKQFDTQWKAHIGLFVDYTVALAKGDDAAKQQAADGLQAYAEGFSQFLATATDGDQAAYQSALEEHVAELAGALEAAKAGDADTAWTDVRKAYAHMFMTGDALVTAIVAQNPDKFPAGESAPAAEGDAMAANG